MFVELGFAFFPIRSYSALFCKCLQISVRKTWTKLSHLNSLWCALSARICCQR